MPDIASPVTPNKKKRYVKDEQNPSLLHNLQVIHATTELLSGTLIRKVRSSARRFLETHKGLKNYHRNSAKLLHSTHRHSFAAVRLSMHTFSRKLTTHCCGHSCTEFYPTKRKMQKIGQHLIYAIK